MRRCNKADKNCKNCGHEKEHEYLSERNHPMEPKNGWCSNKFCSKKKIKVTCKIVS